jgi:2-keto-4-pentenoate hydratase/2-oxohepta-3-ene-1,7-dioic acid hydratase in catechol pathway
MRIANLAGRATLVTDQGLIDVAEIISDLSDVVELRPGGRIFTGSPHGVEQGQTPPVSLKPGNCVVTEIERLGRSENVII